MVTVVPITDLNAFFDEMEERRRQLDAAVKDWQRALKPGDCAIRGHVDDGNVLTIYSRFMGPHPNDGDTAANHLLGRHYSPLCPEGELGIVHVALYHERLTDWQMAKARMNGWPQTLRILEKQN